MADIPELRLVTNRFGDMSLVYGGRAYKLRYTANGQKTQDIPNRSLNPTEGNVAGSQPGFWPPPPSYQAATGQQYYPPPSQPSGQTFYVPVTNITAVPVETAIVARLCPRCQIGTLSEVSNTALTIFIFLGVICFFPIGLLYLFCLPPSISYRCCNCGFES
ncbi:putative brain protein I3 [Trichinella spiralis]|uniref:putative brain protein I3 n=1 Tax=Trichinella spiralis TaxID=6334 RepID=UPI0001EFB4FF|nr:putative brain protein I3 [Trichinella spiralis]